MINLNKFEIIKECYDMGLDYVTEDSSLFFYSLVKMKKPEKILELGTGNGATAFLIALALSENNKGTITTIDNASAWKGDNTLSDHIEKYKIKWNLQNYLNFKLEDINLNNISYMKNVDIVTSDFLRTPEFVGTLIYWWLLNSNTYSSLFIDGLSDFYPGFSFVTDTFKFFNKNIVPTNFPKNTKEYINYKFTQLNIRKTENEKLQNGITWIKKEPHTIGIQKLKG